MADLLYGVKGALADNVEDVIIEDEAPDSIPKMDMGSLPSPEELLKMLEGLTGLSDEDKETLRKDLLKNVANGNQYGIPVTEAPEAEPFTSQALILFAFLAVIALIFVQSGRLYYTERLTAGFITRTESLHKSLKVKFSLQSLKMAEIIDKIKETVNRGPDEIIQKLKETLNLGPELNEKLTTMMNKYAELDDEEKADFANHVKDTFKNKLTEFSSNMWLKSFWALSRSWAAIIIAVTLIIFVFVFFGYKLYNSLMERERKREEKKKLKQLKKKK